MHPLDDAPDLCRLGAADLARRYAAGLSPVEVTRAVLDRARQVNERCAAFTFLDEEGALATARASEARWRAGAPLSSIDGVPTTIKDIVYVRGWTVRYGTTAVPGIAAEEDAPSVGLLRSAGAVLIGLTATPEFGWKALTDSTVSGITRNPWDLSRTPGGSSGGAGAAAVLGAGALHLGSDGGGSIRIPSSFCGIAGLKPTFGRVPAYPASPFGTVSHVGPMARSVDDLALMLDVFSARDLRDWYQCPLPFPPATPLAERPTRGLRLGVWASPPEGAVDPAVRTVFDRALARLTAAGVVLEEIALPAADLPALFRTHWFAGAAARLAAVPAERHASMDAGLQEIAQAGARLSALELIAAHGARAAFGASFDRLLAAHDALISPAVAVPPFAAGVEVPPGSGMTRWIEWAGFSYPVNLAQAPACVIPGGTSPGGLPIGLQIVGRRGDDGGVLAIAKTVLGATQS
ncbi:MAG: amidase [Alphaproteobacteria bacterium]|nr:amidase [Alphaproteobacteria bacterium]